MRELKFHIYDLTISSRPRYINAIETFEESMLSTMLNYNTNLRDVRYLLAEHYGCLVWDRCQEYGGSCPGCGTVAGYMKAGFDADIDAIIRSLDASFPSQRSGL